MQQSLRRGRLAAAACVGLLAVTLGEPQPPRVPGRLRADLACRHFLFIRHNTVNGAAQTDTLVWATVTPSGYDLRDVYTQSNLSVGTRLLTVVGGKAYLVHTGDLLCVDLESGACTRLEQYVGEVACHGDKLYAVHGERLREYDLTLEHWRDVAALKSWRHNSELCLSPDGRRLAVFGSAGDDDPLGIRCRLRVIEVATGTVRELGEPVCYMPPMYSSFAAPGPPAAWLDNTRILFVYSDIPKPTPAAGHTVAVGFDDASVNRVAVAAVVSGQVTNVTTLPGNVGFGGLVELLPARHGMPPTLLYRNPRLGGEVRYAVDLEKRKLVENWSVGGHYSLRYDRERRDLLCRGDLVASLGSKVRLALSADLKQVVWLNGDAHRLQHFHVDDGFVREVASGWFGDPLLWFEEAGLERVPHTGGRLGPDWHSFERTPYPVKRAPDTRKPIDDFLSFEFACDKPTYRIHEPVRLTMTLTNRSADTEFQVAPPSPDWRVARVTLDYPGGFKIIDRFWGGDEVNPVERVSLKPGQRVEGTVVLETTRPGEYKLSGELNSHGGKFKSPIDLRGRLRATPVRFTVEDSPEADALLETKVDRLLDTLREQHKRAPSWDGWVPAVDDLRDLGSAAVPKLLTAAREEEAPLLLRRLLSVLNSLESEAALPLYRKLLAHQDLQVRKLALRGLSGLRNRGNAEAERLLVTTAADPTKADEIRREAGRLLADNRSDAALAVFSRCIETDDGLLLPLAAPTLATWEELDLADWLATAAREPTKARFAAAGVIFTDLEKTWHLEDMPNLEGLTWEAVQAGNGALSAFRSTVGKWEAWARENARVSAAYFDRGAARWW